MMRRRDPPWILVSAGGPVSDLAFLADRLAALPPPRAVIAVDAGLHHLVALGREPDLLLGDMDSAGPLRDRLAPTVEQRRFPREKDQTDLELAFELLRREHRPCRVVILGGLGARLDHTFTNVFLLPPLMRAGFDPVFVDRSARVRLVRDRAVLDRDHYHWISLVPMTHRVTGVRTRGLRFPLTGETLHQERGRGVSNEHGGERATITVASGTLMVIETERDAGD